MSNLTHGMNIEEVRALGQMLQAKKGEIEQLIHQIEAKVSSAGWEGPDARTFKDQWWPEHRGHLSQMGEALHGFGVSAMNNASAQESASQG